MSLVLFITHNVCVTGGKSFCFCQVYQVYQVYPAACVPLLISDVFPCAFSSAMQTIEKKFPEAGVPLSMLEPAFAVGLRIIHHAQKWPGAGNLFTQKVNVFEGVNSQSISSFSQELIQES